MDAFPVSQDVVAGADGARLGTRFLVFPQPPFVPGYERPEVVWLTPSPGELLPGPADRRMYVANPVEPKAPYGFPDLPPYPGPAPAAGRARPRRPLRPPDAGHGRVPRRPLLRLRPPRPRHLRGLRRPRDPLVLPAGGRAAGDRAADPGLGQRPVGLRLPRARRERRCPTAATATALNFDTIAHEVGHLVLFGELGLPQGTPGRDFAAYHEAVADFISLLGLLQFDTALDRLLRRTQGNLLIHNELDRFAETSAEKQVRSFSNSLRLGDVSFEAHDRSKPFGAALFDCLIEVHQALLFDRGLSDLDPRAFSDLRRQIDPAEIVRELAGDRSGYEFRHFAVKAALAEARDIIGEALVRSWRVLDPDDLDFATAAEAFLDAMDRGRGPSLRGPGRRLLQVARDLFRLR